jgi:hypothetical protein
VPPTSTTFFSHRHFGIARYLYFVTVFAVSHLTVSLASVSPITDRRTQQGASEWRVIIMVSGMRMLSVSLYPSRDSCASFYFCSVKSSFQHTRDCRDPSGQQHISSEDLCTSTCHATRSRATPGPQRDEVDPTARHIPASRNEPGACSPRARTHCPRACSSSL